MLLNGVAVGHARQVITDRAWPAIAPGAFSGGASYVFMMSQVVREKVFQDEPCAGMRFIHGGTVVEVLVQELAQLRIELSAPGTIPHQRHRV